MPVLAEDSIRDHSVRVNSVRVEGFARLFEEEIPLPDALVSIEEYAWDEQLETTPVLINSFSVRTNSQGRFSTQVARNHWFRLTLHEGEPRSFKEARNAWIQHVDIVNALMELESVDQIVEFFLARKITIWTQSKLLNYISMDSSLMYADKHYWTSSHEISFQVPLKITYELMKILGMTIYGTEFNPEHCHLAITALAPDNSHSEHLAESSLCTSYCFKNCSQPKGQTLKDCPHGAEGVTFQSSPVSELIHYMGIKSSCKTDLLATGLNSTSRDGGALLPNMRPSKKVAYVDAFQNSDSLGRQYFLCSPGSIINISPPQGPIGRKDESIWVPQEGETNLRVTYAIIRFIDYLFPEIQEATSVMTYAAMTMTGAYFLWACLWSRTILSMSAKYIK